MDSLTCPICFTSDDAATSSKAFVQQECCQQWIHEVCREEWLRVSSKNRYAGGCPMCRYDAKDPAESSSDDSFMNPVVFAMMTLLINQLCTVTLYKVMNWYFAKYRSYVEPETEFDMSFEELYQTLYTHHPIQGGLDILKDDPECRFTGPLRGPLYKDCDYTLLKMICIVDTCICPVDFDGEIIDDIRNLRVMFNDLIESAMEEFLFGSPSI